MVIRMSKAIKLMNRYKMALGVCFLNLALLPFVPEMSLKAFRLTGESILDMMMFIPPVFVMLGLLDVWIERETMMRYMGKGSGGKGLFLAFMLGSMAAGPLYMAFPIAAMLIRKGTSFFNVFIFIGAWATTKVPMLLFETFSLGFNYMLIRLILNVCGIIVISLVLERSLSVDDRTAILQNAERMQGEHPSSGQI